jgi:hypothetical protein
MQTQKPFPPDNTKNHFIVLIVLSSVGMALPIVGSMIGYDALIMIPLICLGITIAALNIIYVGAYLIRYQISITAKILCLLLSIFSILFIYLGPGKDIILLNS